MDLVGRRSDRPLFRRILQTHQVLFASVSESSSASPVRIYNFPSPNPAAPVQYACHSLPATRVRVTANDDFFCSVSEDGSLFIFEIKKKDRTAKKKEATGWADEILVTRTFLDGKQAQLQELERQVEDLLSQVGSY